VTHDADPRVDAYIDALPDWQQAICREVRDLVHAADHEVAETIKRTNRLQSLARASVVRCQRPRDGSRSTSGQGGTNGCLLASEHVGSKRRSVRRGGSRSRSRR
jgi:hypothetical protein